MATQVRRSWDGKLGGEAKVVKLGWPKGGVETLATWLQVSPGHLPHPRLRLHGAFAVATGGHDFPGEPGS